MCAAHHRRRGGAWARGHIRVAAHRRRAENRRTEEHGIEVSQQNRGYGCPAATKEAL